MAARSAPRPGGKAASQRQLRVGELVRHAMAEILARDELMEPELDGIIVTVPEVRMTPDLRLATCFVRPLGDADPKAVAAILDRHRKFLRGAVAGRIDLRYAPDIRFRVDTSFDTGATVDEILRRPDVRRDVTGGGDGE